MRKLHLLPVLSAAIIFAGCESNHLFKSEKTVKKDIQGIWKMQIISIKNDKEQTWDFNGEKLIISRTDTNLVDTVDYSINVTLSAPYVKIDGVKKFDTKYNTKWTVVQLDGHILDIAADNPDNAGVQEREFTKQ
jgi:hypothetical protein